MKLGLYTSFLLKSNEALIEFTLFTKSILKNSEYEKVLKEYLNNKEIDSYEILEKEKGVIPMTSHTLLKNTIIQESYLLAQQEDGPRPVQVIHLKI